MLPCGAVPCVEGWLVRQAAWPHLQLAAWEGAAACCLLRALSCPLADLLPPQPAIVPPQATTRLRLYRGRSAAPLATGIPRFRR
jgi:hypothetical protein